MKKLIAVFILGIASLCCAQISTGGGGGGSMTWPATPGIPVCTGTPCTAWGTTLADPLAVGHGGSGTASTLTGIVRGGNPFAASELSGDCATSGSNVVTCAKLNGNTFPSGAALGDIFYGSAANAISKLAGPTATNSVPQFLQETPAANAAVAPVWAPAGVPIRASTCTANADTVLATDRASYVSWSDASACAVTLPQAGTTGFASNFVTLGCDIGAGTATITPTTSTISYTTGTAYTSGAASLALTTGQCAWIYSDNTNYFAIVRSGNASNSFPLTVSGATSGGIPCFTGTTTESSSALLATNVLTKGGGAGACPTNSLTTDDGTTRTYTGTGGDKAPVYTATGTTAGFWDFPQGTTSAAVAPCNVATSICEQAPTAVTSYLLVKPGAAPTIVSYKQTDTCGSAVCTESFHPAPIVLKVTADFTTASATGLQAITGLSFTFPINSALNARIECDVLYHQNTAAVADNWGVQDVSVAPTNIEATAFTQTAATTWAEGSLLTLATTTATNFATFTPSAITTDWHAQLHLMVEHPSNAATSVLQLMTGQATAADTITIRRGSNCLVTFQ